MNKNIITFLIAWFIVYQWNTDDTSIILTWKENSESNIIRVLEEQKEWWANKKILGVITIDENLKIEHYEIIPPPQPQKTTLRKVP